ncbi:unnamed protein product [Cochlearia groenlandica]
MRRRSSLVHSAVQSPSGLLFYRIRPGLTRTSLCLRRNSVSFRGDLFLYCGLHGSNEDVRPWNTPLSLRVIASKYSPQKRGKFPPNGRDHFHHHPPSRRFDFSFSPISSQREISLSPSSSVKEKYLPPPPPLTPSRVKISKAFPFVDHVVFMDTRRLEINLDFQYCVQAFLKESSSLEVYGDVTKHV